VLRLQQFLKKNDMSERSYYEFASVGGAEAKPVVANTGHRRVGPSVHWTPPLA